jgi:5-(carboxyamino)imidazole ribonucleotide synthase
MSEGLQVASPQGAQDGRPAPAGVVGMVGAGQLARMSLPAANELDIDLRLLARGPGEPGAAAVTAFGEPDDLEALRDFASGCDALTFDHEGSPAPVLQALERDGVRVRPGSEALLMAQDKLHARERFTEMGAPIPPWASVTSVADAEAFAAEHGWPIVLKARRGGYDGRGVVFAKDAADAAGALELGIEWVAEPELSLDCEISQLLVRGVDGEIATYPTVRTVQLRGICVETRFPAELDPGLELEAQRLGREIAAAIGAVGIVAVELFVVDGRLLVNELALRPHNSGHWTIEGCDTSQFENHLRAVLGWPLGSTEPRSTAAVMRNVLGAPEAAARLPGALAPGVHPHIYGKEGRPGRKVAHVTALAADLGDAAERADRAALALGDGGPA